MWAYFGKIWDTNVSIFWQKVDSNPNVSIMWQNPKRAFFGEFDRFNELFNFLPKSTFWTKIRLLIKVWFRSTASFTTAKRGRKECRLRYRRLLQQLLEKASWIPLKSAVFSLVHKVRLSRILGLSFPSFGAVSEKKFRIFSVAQTDKS